VARAAAGAGRNAQSGHTPCRRQGAPPEWLAAAAGCGLQHFGESYLQEALAKIAALAIGELTWHLSGGCRPTRPPIAEAFGWGARTRPAQDRGAPRRAAPVPRTAAQRLPAGDLAQERTKGGVTPAELPALAAAVARLPRLALRGPDVHSTEESEPARQRAWFARLRELLERLNAAGARLDTLSMGMSGDFEAATCRRREPSCASGRRCLAPAS